MLILSSCGNRNNNVPKTQSTPVPTKTPPAHGFPEGYVSAENKLKILERLEENGEILYYFEVTSRSKDIVPMLGESDMWLDATGYVRGNGTEGFVKLTVDNIDERIYWKAPNIYHRVEKDLFGKTGNPNFVRIKREGGLQERAIKVFSLPNQIALLKKNVDLIDMTIYGDNVYIILKDTGAKDLNLLLQPQVDFAYYIGISQQSFISVATSYHNTEEMLLEWVFNLSEIRALDFSYQAFINLNIAGFPSKCNLEIRYLFGLVENPELPPPENIIRD